MTTVEAKLAELEKRLQDDYEAGTGWTPAHQIAQDAISLVAELIVQ